MELFLTKLIPIFIYPLGLAIVFCLLGLAFLGAGERKRAGLALILSVLVLWVPSTTLFADFLLGSLERNYPPVAVGDLPRADAVVILGGMTSVVESDANLIGVSEAADRLLFGASLYKAGKAPVVILSGGSEPGLIPEAESMAKVMVFFDVPAEDMLLETTSRNTVQNAADVLPLLQQHEISRILLVTSAYHMKRAAAIFAASGVDFVPAPTDYQVILKKSSVLDWLPDAGALHRTTIGIKEYIGWWYCALRGWI